MLANYKNTIKAIGTVAAVSTVVYLSYDYGVVTTKVSAQRAHDSLWEKVEQKQNEAFQLAVTLANQQPDIRIQYREIEKEVIKYAQKHNDKQCVARDAEWLHIRAETVRAHNRAIGFQRPAPITDGAATTFAYQLDAEVLAEDVANIETCTENAQRLRALQLWIKAQLQ